MCCTSQRGLPLTGSFLAGGVAADSVPGMPLLLRAVRVPLSFPQLDRAISIDTTPVSTTICHLISEGATETALLAAVAQAFPQLTPAELSEALQAGTEQAERQAAMRH